MKCVTHTLTMMLVLVLGFLVGAEVPESPDNVEGLQTRRPSEEQNLGAQYLQ
jgi:hypothetical protein